MNELEKDVLSLRLAEQAILRQVLEEKAQRLQELDVENRTLRRLLNELTAVPQPQPQAQAAAPAARPLGGPVPRRWQV